MNPWSTAFVSHLTRKKIPRGAVAKKFGVSVSTVHYWLHDSIPRPEMQKRIAKWSGGAVPCRVDQ